MLYTSKRSSINASYIGRQVAPHQQNSNPQLAVVHVICILYFFGKKVKKKLIVSYNNNSNRQQQQQLPSAILFDWRATFGTFFRVGGQPRQILALVRRFRQPTTTTTTTRPRN
jgi:hypothetical protein